MFMKILIHPFLYLPDHILQGSVIAMAVFYPLETVRTRLQGTCIVFYMY